MTKIRVLCFCFLFLLIAALASPVAASALEDPGIESGCAVILCHNDSGTTLYESAVTRRVPAGPGARLLAAVVLAEAYEGKTEKIVSVNRKVTGLAASTMNPGLKNGEHISVYDLLCGMLVASSDDAAYALAFDLFEDDPDAPAKLVDLMNDKAEELGLEDSEFSDFLGTEPKDAGGAKSESTLSDLLLVALAAQRSPLLREICALESRTVPATDKTKERLLLTRNYLLSAKRIPGYTYANATGLFAYEGTSFGSCGIFSSEAEGRAYTCIVIGSKEKYGAFKIAKTMFEWGKNNFSYKKILDKSEVLGEIKVELSGDSDYVTLSPDSALSAFLPNDVDLQTEIKREIVTDLKTVRAPVKEGMVAGKITVFYRNRQIGQADLVTTGSLALSNSGYYLSLARDFLTSSVFLWSCAGVAVCFLVYVLINARVRYLRKTRPQALAFDDGDEPEREERVAESAVFGALGDGSEAGESSAESEVEAQTDIESEPREPKEKKPEHKEKKERAERRSIAPGAVAEKSGEPGEEDKKNAKADKKSGAHPPKEESAGRDARKKPKAKKAQVKGARVKQPEGEQTLLERMAQEERRALEEEKRKQEEARKAAEEAEREARRRAKTFYDDESGGEVPAGLPEEDVKSGEYVPEGWGDLGP